MRNRTLPRALCALRGIEGSTFLRSLGPWAYSCIHDSQRNSLGPDMPGMTCRGQRPKGRRPWECIHGSHHDSLCPGEPRGVTLVGTGGWRSMVSWSSSLPRGSRGIVLPRALPRPPKVEESIYPRSLELAARPLPVPCGLHRGRIPVCCKDLVWQRTSLRVLQSLWL